MDPNETLARLRKEVANHTTDAGIDADAVADLVDALDGWLSKGGFLPDAWAADWQHTGDLTGNDHILTRGAPGIDHSYALPYSLGINLHLQPETPINVRLHLDEHRAVIHLGVTHAEVALFVDDDQAVRLANLFTHIRQRMC